MIDTKQIALECSKHIPVDGRKEFAHYMSSEAVIILCDRFLLAVDAARVSEVDTQLAELAAQNEAMRSFLPHVRIMGRELEQQYLSALASINLPAEILRKRDEAKDARIAELEAEAFNFRISIGFLTDKVQQLAAQIEEYRNGLDTICEPVMQDHAGPTRLEWFLSLKNIPDNSAGILQQRDAEKDEQLAQISAHNTALETVLTTIADRLDIVYPEDRTAYEEAIQLLSDPGISGDILRHRDETVKRETLMTAASDWEKTTHPNANIFSANYVAHDLRKMAQASVPGSEGLDGETL